MLTLGADALLAALIGAGVTILVAWLVQRPRSLAEAEKMHAEKERLIDQSERESIAALTQELHEARENVKKYRRQLREHGIDPNSDTGPKEGKK